MTNVPCAGCGRLLLGGSGSLPAGERMCRDCRAERRRPVPPPVLVVECAECRDTFETTVPSQLYCGPNCKQRAKRHRRPKAPPAPRPPTTRCVDCGAPIPLQRRGSPLLRCAPCRLFRASARDLERRRQLNDARARLDTSERPSRLSRLLDRIHRRETGK